jgi:hypothetical protein
VTTRETSLLRRSQPWTRLNVVIVLAALLVAFAQTGRAQHNHDTNRLAVYINPPTPGTNHLLIHYFVQPNKTFTLQYKPLSATNLQTQPWINFPSGQAPRFPYGIDWAIPDYSVTNRSPTNRGRIYRLRIT